MSVAVVGPGTATPSEVDAAYAAGRACAAAGLVVVTGGLGGVMAAASHGAHDAGGTTIGLLPGTDPAAANPWVHVAVPTGLGEGRNLLVVRAARAVLAIGGNWGTLAEVALARHAGTPVVAWRSWTPYADGAPVPGGPVVVDDLDAAVAALLAVAR